MARNYVNYSFGKYSIEPMSDEGKSYTTLTGKLCLVKEKLTYKKYGTFHWLSLGFDADSKGPTKRVFFDIAKDKEIIWLFQMAKHDLFLQEGDDVTIKYSGGYLTMLINGVKVPKASSSRASAVYKDLYKCRRIYSIEEFLRSVCPWALPADVTDEVAEEAPYRCREFLCNLIRDVTENELRVIIKRLCIGNLPDNLTFKEIHKELTGLQLKDALGEYSYSLPELKNHNLDEKANCCEVLQTENEFSVNDFD
jgi:hypothetical protein